MPRDFDPRPRRRPTGNKTLHPDTMRRAKRRGDRLAQRIDERRVERAAEGRWSG